MTMISYAQNYEDVMLARALADVGEGFYVDVGAQHPINGSVTKAFQVRGWRGINIEPVERWFRLICDDRPHDINLSSPVSDLRGYMELFDVEDTGLSTVREDYAQRYTKDGWNVVKKKLKAHTLNAIFRAYAPKDVHFLKVDVEGAEAAVLRSLDLNRYRPWIILVEATKPNSPEPVFGEWEPMLLAAGYIFAYDDGLNRFYVAPEHQERIKYFSRPPNFFDNFVTYPESWAREQMERLTREVEAEREEVQRIREKHDAVVAVAQHLQNMQADILDGMDERFAAFGERLQADILRGLDERFAAVGKRVGKRISHQVQDGVDEVDEQLEYLAERVASSEAALERVHERLGFADNVHVALLDVLGRERAVDAKLQQVLHSRSWRITKGFRFIARVLRAMLRRQPAAEAGLNKSTATRLLVAVTNNPVLRRVGSVLLIATPGLKARLVRTVVANAQPAPPAFVPPVRVPGSLAHLPARARTVRSMLDNVKKSS
jgi:FkbM family methyltransferase